MNNPGISSFTNSNQNTTCKQQVDFEHEINENIIPTRQSSHPTELNILCNENTVDNISPSVETLTCLQEFDKILDNVRENKVPIGINTQYEIEIDIEGVHLNDLATLSDINKSSVDNFDDWQNVNNFVKNTELNTVEHCSNNEEDRNGNYLETPIDNNEHSNVNNHLNTWKSIYEDFSAKTNNITGTSAEKQTIAEERIKNVLDDLSAIENDKTYYLNSEIRISKTPSTSANKTIKTNLQTKRKIPTDSLKISTFDTQHKHEILNLIQNPKNERQIRANLLEKNVPYTRFKIEDDDTVIEPHSNLSCTNILQKEYQGKCVRMQGQANNKRLLINSNKVDKIANEIIIISSDDEDDVKIIGCNKPIDKETNDPNTFEKPERQSSKCFDIHDKPTLTTEKQDLVSNGNKCLNYIKNPTNTYEFKKHEVESINLKYLEKPVTEESSNTRELAEEQHESKNNEYLNIYKQYKKEFEKQENYSDCDGYNSSDFEFIDEDEATKNVPNLSKSLFDESIYLKATTNNGPHFEADTATTNNNNFVCSEIKDENGAELPLPSIESLFAIHDNQKAINFNEFCDEDNIILDYFITVEPTANVNEFDSSYRDSHRIPNDDEFVNLFGGNFTPYPMFSFENKATHFGTGMTPDSGVGFDMSIFRDEDESTSEQRREATESELKIRAMYAIENRSPRRRR